MVTATDVAKMRHQTDFMGVLTNMDDQVVVRELLSLYVPEDVQRMVVRAFNTHVDRYNARLAR